MLEPKQQSRIDEIIKFWSEIADGSRITDRTKSLADVKELVAIIVSCVLYSDKLSKDAMALQDALLVSQEAYHGLVDQIECVKAAEAAAEPQEWLQPTIFGEDLDADAHPSYPTVTCVG